MNRREFLTTGLGGALVVAGGGVVATRFLQRWSPTGSVREIRLTAQVADWQVGPGTTTRAWTYNGQVPGPEIRVKEGERLRVILDNDLPEPTTLHWHGLPVPHAMDGVPGLTQPAVQPGQQFTYEFTAGPAGTYWYHSHVGYQFDRGLFGPLIVEPACESLTYDREYVLVFDDWLFDATNPLPDPAMGMGEPGEQPLAHGPGMLRPQPLYDALTVNGRSGDHPPLMVRRGDRVRLRLVNASASTVVPLRLAGHRLTITHSDGQALEASEADLLRLGMGERYDVLFTADRPGVWPLEILGAGRHDPGLRVRYEGIHGTQDSAAPTVRPIISNYRDLQGPEAAGVRVPDRIYELALSGGLPDQPGAWMINGRRYPETDPLEVREGERVRLLLHNLSGMPHPMHLHGHFFDLVGPDGVPAVAPIRKDTLVIGHGQLHVVEFTADNPGAHWLLHCHQLYHHHGGMATEVRYQSARSSPRS